MKTASTSDLNELHSLSWYMAARQTALRTALSFRSPLSVAASMDMRVQYSNYFVNLISATELLRGSTALQRHRFEALLYERLRFEGFDDGVANYSYVRELRNAVIHRGLDITGSAHFDGNFPMILAEPAVQNQSKTKAFVAFGKYLLDVIARCESVVGPAMLDHLEAVGAFGATIDVNALAAEGRRAIERSHAMPDQIKALALSRDIPPEIMVAAHSSAMTSLRRALTPFAVTTPSLP